MSTELKPKQMVYLVGGKGTRLGDLTKNTPKPLLDIDGIPFIEYALESAVRQGVEKVLFLAGFKGEMFMDYCPIFNKDLIIECLVESEPLGTGGAIAHAKHLLDPYFFLANGDSLFNLKLYDLTKVPKNDEWLGVIALRRENCPSRYGSVELNGDLIKSFNEKGNTLTGLINGGVYLLNRKIINLIDQNGMASSLENDIFPLITKLKKLYGKEFYGEFIDIGIPESFKIAQNLIPNIIRLK